MDTITDTTDIRPGRAERALPQLDADLFLTDGGIETTLIFDDGFDLPDFAAFVLLDSDEGRAALRRYYETYLDLAARDGLGIVLESATWRVSADWAARAGLAIDGNPSTMWGTDTYSDPVPFPGFKNGVGLLLQPPQPTKIASVDIGVTGTGTAIQIRSAATPTPATLDDTTALTQPTTMKTGNNTITVNASAPTSTLLVWISTLGTVDGKSRTDITDITLHAAS